MNEAHTALVTTQVDDIKAPPQNRHWTLGPAVIDTWYDTLKKSSNSHTKKSSFYTNVLSLTYTFWAEIHR